MNRVLRAILLLSAVSTLPVLYGCGSPPQLGDSEEALGVADELFTAVTSKRTNLVDASAARITQLKDAGKIPPDAAAALDTIVAQARAGKWDAARDDLRTFVKGQRRSK